MPQRNWEYLVAIYACMYTFAQCFVFIYGFDLFAMPSLQSTLRWMNFINRHSFTTRHPIDYTFFFIHSFILLHKLWMTVLTVKHVIHRDWCVYLLPLYHERISSAIHFFFFAFISFTFKSILSIGCMNVDIGILNIKKIFHRPFLYCCLLDLPKSREKKREREMSGTKVLCHLFAVHLIIQNALTPLSVVNENEEVNLNKFDELNTFFTHFPTSTNAHTHNKNLAFTSCILKHLTLSAWLIYFIYVTHHVRIHMCVWYVWLSISSSQLLCHMCF